MKVSFKNPKNTLTIGDDVYKLQQFHFHAPSENEIDGQTYTRDYRRLIQIIILIRLRYRAGYSGINSG